MSTQKAATENLQPLEPFVGIWETEGKMRASASGQPEKFSANDTYEWVSGGHFLLHRFDADMPDGKVKGIEFIGYDRDSQSYLMRSFDNSGSVTLMRARLEKDTWTFVGEGIRFTGGFRENGKIFEGLWELRSEDQAAWQPLMDVSLRKIG